MRKIDEDKAFKIAHELAIKAVEAGYFSAATKGSIAGNQIADFITTIADRLSQEEPNND